MTASSIRRKPVPSPLALSDLPHHHSSHLGSGLVESPSSTSPPDYNSATLPLAQNPGRNGPTSTAVAAQSLRPLTIDDDSPSPADSAIGSAHPTQAASLSPATLIRPTSEVLGSAFKHAFGEARYFAGGLVTHPHESTKHYSIQRHSHSFIYYAGHYTSLALSVFADRPLPPDRSYWLQRKGFSGHSGLTIGALMGAHGSWVDVTPAAQATPGQIKPADERAYQRDIDRFLRRATKKTRNHVPRETCILRIPCEAHDGYLRVVLCAGEGGKKALCPSPVFRLFSTSTDSSTIRGASLKTLPLEMGIKVGSMIANTAARSAVTATAGPLVSSAKQVVGSQITGLLQPTALEQGAATLLYDQAASSVTDKVDALDAEAQAARESKYKPTYPDTATAVAAAAAPGDVLALQPGVVGDDSGPAKPFPVHFHSTVVRGRTGKSCHELGIPTADLAHFDSDISLRFGGVYIGWAAISLPKATKATKATKTKQEDAATHDDVVHDVVHDVIDDQWHEAIIYITPRHIDGSSKSRDIVQQKAVQVHILQDFEGATFFGARVSLIMMAFLRPAAAVVDVSQHEKQEEEKELQMHQTAFVRDAACTAASLARPEWTVDAALSRIKEERASRSMSERYVDLREGAQKSIDKVPLHRLGVRTEGHEMRDRLIGNGGVWIKR
ncbi:hypothetical protein DV736_g873, partial [Chaetothyriales sp. CBS 134916]